MDRGAEKHTLRHGETHRGVEGIDTHTIVNVLINTGGEGGAQKTHVHMETQRELHRGRTHLQRRLSFYKYSKCSFLS